MPDGMPDPVASVVDAIKRWEQAKQNMDDLQRQRNRASCELINATNALGKAMAPNDAQDGETFSIWYGDRLLMVTQSNGGADFEVHYRS